MIDGLCPGARTGAGVTPKVLSRDIGPSSFGVPGPQYVMDQCPVSDGLSGFSGQ